MNARRLSYREHGTLQLLLLLCLAPDVTELPTWAWSLTGLLVAIKGALWLTQRLSVPRLLTALAGLLVIPLSLGIGLRVGGALGRDLAVALLGQFAVLKLLETRDVRDGVVLLQLGFFLLLTHFLFEEPPWLAAYVFTVGLALLRSWLLLCHPDAAGRVVPLRAIGQLLLIGTPWVLALFFLFPRLEHPLWQLPRDSSLATSGVSDRMAPGTIANLAQSTAIAFRAEFDGAAPPPEDRYWRALVLWRYDGTTWQTAPWRRRQPQRLAATTGPETRYALTLEPHRQRWLYLLDRGKAIRAGAFATLDQDDESFIASRIDSRLRYLAVSVVGRPDRSALDPDSAQLALDLPPGNPRTRQLAAGWQARYPDPRQRVNAALALFRDQPFAYTLHPPLLGTEAMDDFLFRSRRGFCEHYAGTFVFLMRAAGVPARVVVGYLGGEFNPVGQYYIVRQADAHAWAEVWLPGQGWVRVDPTAAVSPQRVEQGIDGALPADESQAIRATRTPGWLLSLRWRLDSVVNVWNRWVLSYDRQRQNELLRRLGFDDGGLGIARPLIIAIAALMLVTLVSMYRRRRGEPPDPLQREYTRFCRQLARLGCPRHPAEGPRDFAARAGATLPAHAEAISAFLHRYIALRYQGAVTTHGARELKRLRAALS